MAIFGKKQPGPNGAMHRIGWRSFGVDLAPNYATTRVQPYNPHKLKAPKYDIAASTLQPTWLNPGRVVGSMLVYPPHLISHPQSLQWQKGLGPSGATSGSMGGTMFQRLFGINSNQQGQ